MDGLRDRLGDRILERWNIIYCGFDRVEFRHTEPIRDLGIPESFQICGVSRKSIDRVVIRSRLPYVYARTFV